MVFVHSEHNAGSNLYQISVCYSTNGKNLTVVSSNEAYTPANLVFSLNTDTGVVSVTNGYGVYINFIAYVMATSFTSSI